MYLRALKWINQCAISQRRGIKPGIPPNNTWQPNLVRYFEPLPLDSDGRCQQPAAKD
jgi:hypothetical protein